MSNAANVTTGKPRVAGAVYRAPLGTTIPTDASTALDTAFAELGFVSEDGVANNNSQESDNIKAWGGQVVLVVTTEKPDEWTMTLIEAMNVEVLKTVYGDDNVTENTQAGTITVKATAAELAASIYVIEVVMKGGAKKRIVIPLGVPKELGEITYRDDEAVGYELTLSALPDTTGTTHYEYIQIPT